MAWHTHRLSRRRLLAGLGAGLGTVGSSVSGAAQQGTPTPTSETLSFGETFVAPNQVAVTIQRLQVSDSYEYNLAGQTTATSAPSGQQFAWVTLKVENRSSGRKYIPFPDEIVVRAGNREFSYAYPWAEQGMYESGQVGPGVVRQGWLMYKIPANVPTENLKVIWYGENYPNQWTATWTGEVTTGSPFQGETTSPGAGTGTTAGTSTPSG